MYYTVVPSNCNGFYVEKLQNNYSVLMGVRELIWGVVWKMGNSVDVDGDFSKTLISSGNEWINECFILSYLLLFMLKSSYPNT